MGIVFISYFALLPRFEHNNQNTNIVEGFIMEKVYNRSERLYHEINIFIIGIHQPIADTFIIKSRYPNLKELLVHLYVQYMGNHLKKTSSSLIHTLILIALFAQTMQSTHAHIYRPTCSNKYTKKLRIYSTP